MNAEGTRLDAAPPGDRRVLVAAAYRTSYEKVNDVGGVPEKYRAVPPCGPVRHHQARRPAARGGALVAGSAAVPHSREGASPDGTPRGRRHDGNRGWADPASLHFSTPDGTRVTGVQPEGTRVT